MLDSQALNELRSRHEVASAIGTILYRKSGALPPIDPAASTAWWPPAGVAVDAFTAEFGGPTSVVRVAATTPSSTSQAASVLVIAMSTGKAVTATFASGNGTPVTLTGSRIDAVVVYVAGALSLTICIAPPADPDDADWTTVPYLVKGLTLPIREADPSLGTPAAELNAAQKRLVSGEVFTQADLDNVAPALRMAISAQSLGRVGERILLLRTTTEEPFAELAFSHQLTLLQIHPRLRRVLGFGYFDHQSSGLVFGQSYEYRITGHFDGADLADAIYDVQTVSSQTMLPARFHIRPRADVPASGAARARSASGGRGDGRDVPARNSHRCGNARGGMDRSIARQLERGDRFAVRHGESRSRNECDAQLLLRRRRSVVVPVERDRGAARAGCETDVPDGGEPGATEWQRNAVRDSHSGHAAAWHRGGRHVADRVCPSAVAGRTVESYGNESPVSRADVHVRERRAARTAPAAAGIRSALAAGFGGQPERVADRQRRRAPDRVDRVSDRASRRDAAGDVRSVGTDPAGRQHRARHA